MTGIAATHALERLGWRCETPVLPPPGVNENLTSIRRFKRVDAEPKTVRVDTERTGT
jgi:hypothetical protein